MSNQKSKASWQDEYKKLQAKQEELLKNTPDEEIGKMYRQHREATRFFTDRGLYI